MKRKLKVEGFGEPEAPYGEPSRARKVQVRLKGKWLQAAGFPAGRYIDLRVISPGVIEIRLCGTETSPAWPGNPLLRKDA